MWVESHNNNTNKEGLDNKCVPLLQGSYGVVKLAYNEDDDKYYVSRSSLPS